MDGHAHSSSGLRTDPIAPPLLDERAAGELSAGQIVAGRYVVLAHLGTGGMGAVWRVHDRELDEDVALKVLRPEWTGNPRMLERLRREVKVARRITHPNVCRVFDFGDDGELCFLTMELVHGRPLRAALSAGRLAPARAISLGLQVADAVAAAHALGIVHRDLKPDNVLVCKDGRAVLADFGLARALELEHRVAASSAGTPVYMAPEQLRGEAVDARTDVFALGMLVFEMLTGSSPFGEGSVTARCNAILRKEPRPLHAPGVPAQVAAALERVLSRAMAKPPEHRFASAALFRDALSEAARDDGDTLLDAAAPDGGGAAPNGDDGLEGERTVPEPNPGEWTTTESQITTPAQRPGRSRRPAAFVLVLLCAALTLWLQREELPEPAAAAPAERREDVALAVVVEPFENLSGDPRWDGLAQGAAEAVRAELRTMRELSIIERRGAAEPLSDGAWVVGGSVQRVGDKLRLTAQFRVRGSAAIEVDDERDEQALLALRRSALDEARLLFREHDRRRRADQSTTNAVARSRLHQYFDMIGPAPRPEHLSPGKKLLDEALAADPEYAPALVERAFLQAIGASSTGEPDKFQLALADVERAAALANQDPSAQVTRCRITQLVVQTSERPTDASIAAAVDACNAAMVRAPSSGYVPLVLARLHHLGCKHDLAITSLMRTLELDRTLSGRALEHLVVLALQSDRAEIADRMSAELVKFHEEEARLGTRALSRRAGVPPTMTALLLRAAALRRVGRLEEARAQLESQLETVAQGRGDWWAEPAAIRGILSIAREQGRPAPAKLEQRLAAAEREYTAAVKTKPYLVQVLASAYEWIDPQAAAQWLDRLGPPTSFADGTTRVLIYRAAGQDAAARSGLTALEPRERWEQACAAWLTAKVPD